MDIVVEECRKLIAKIYAEIADLTPDDLTKESTRDLRDIMFYSISIANKCQDLLFKIHEL